MGLEVSPADVVRLSTFRLAERWIDVLPSDAYVRIHPLTPAKSKEALVYAACFLGDQSEPPPVTTEAKFDASGESGPVREWLLRQHKDRAQQIVAVWNESSAVLTDWGIFCDYWDDFCYPSSDDVIVISLSDRWFLQYGHEETFEFSRIND